MNLLIPLLAAIVYSSVAFLIATIVGKPSGKLKAAAWLAALILLISANWCEPPQAAILAVALASWNAIAYEERL